MGQYLSSPSTEKESDEGHADALAYGLAAMQGWRVSMEDAHIAKLNLDPSNKTSLFAVFDGHGGGAVSQFCAAHLAQELLGSEAYKKGDLAGALTHAYFRLDHLLDSEEGKEELRRLVSGSKPKQAAALFTDVETKLAGAAPAREERVRTSVHEERVRARASEDAAQEAAAAAAAGAAAAPTPAPAPAGGGAAGGDAGALLEEQATKAAKRLGSTKEFVESHLNRASVLTPLASEGEEAAAAAADSQDGLVVLPNGGAGQEEEEEEEHHAAGMGATAVSVLVRGSKVVVANTGDSRCVLSKKGVARALTLDHKPILFEEAKRIIKAGGFVRDNRINGALNVSRTIGDLDFKRNAELPHTEQMVVATPDIETFTLEEGDEFLILACDGIWDVLSNQEAVDFVRKRLKAGEGLKQICEGMCDACLAPDLKGLCRGADNMSVVVVLFKRHAKIGGFWSSLLSACKKTPAYKRH